MSRPKLVKQDGLIDGDDVPVESVWQSRNRRVTGVVVVLALMAAIVSSVAGAAAWQPRDGCGYTVKSSDWRGLANIAKQTQSAATWREIAAQSNVSGPKYIIRVGQKLDICAPDVGNASRPHLKDPPKVAEAVPQRVLDWATVIDRTRPEWATDHQTLFMTAVAGPESDWSCNAWNWNDAGFERATGAEYIGSFGCNQIRVMKHPPRTGFDSIRNRGWLEASLENQAKAAWIILNVQGPKAWGPARNAKGIGTKLPFDGRSECGWAWKPKRCRDWWDMASEARNIILGRG